MENKYTFTSNTMTIRTERNPEGKTFFARYEMQGVEELKRGETTPAVYIYVKADGNTVKIAVPSDDRYYPDACTAFRAQQNESEETSAEQEPEQTTEDAPAETGSEQMPEDTPAEQEQEQEEAPDPKKAHGPIPEKTFVNTSICGERFQIIFDGSANRTRVIIPEEYRSIARDALQKAGFYYSSAMDSFNKKLTFRAYRAAVALAAELSKILAA